MRGASHAFVWIAFFVPMVSELARGWRPFSDDAAIASRAYESLSVHPPLIGIISSAYIGTGHLLLDPGPLLFYVLAVPSTSIRRTASSGARRLWLPRSCRF